MNASSIPALTLPVPMSDRAGLRAYAELLVSTPASVLDLVHEEAFERLTSRQRAAMFDLLTARSVRPEHLPLDATPRELALAAGRVERARPGTLFRLLSGRETTFGVGSALLATFVGYAIGCELSVFYLSASATTGGEPDASVIDVSGFGQNDTGLF